jgi:hypothetical protein
MNRNLDGWRESIRFVAQKRGKITSLITLIHGPGRLK